MDPSPELLAFCKAQHPRLVGLLGLYCGDRAVAEELAQEALARAWRRWPRIRGYANPEAWLQRIALNLANSHYRRSAAERRARARLATRTTVEPGRDTASVLAVRDAIARLPARQRAAIVLRFYVDLPYAQVAERMGVPEPTAKSLVRRGLARLRNQEGLVEAQEVLNAT